MRDLSQDLEQLCKLHEYRRRAKELRQQALPALKKIVPRHPLMFEEPFDPGRWVFGNDDIETALVVKVRSHRELSENESENNQPRGNSDALEGALEKHVNLETLLPLQSGPPPKSTMPVLVAARSMQALVIRAATVFHPVTMFCYYRIVRELYGVAQPNWTVGAARAGIGGTTSAFVTNECIRAIFAFRNSLERTCKFFDETLRFYEYVSSLSAILSQWGMENKDEPLYNWANQSVEARWLDCQLATNPRNREMALFCKAPDDPDGAINALLLPDLAADERGSCISSAQHYFDTLPQKLEEAVEELFQRIAEVFEAIRARREDEEADPTDPPAPVSPVAKVKGKYEFHRDYDTNPKREKEEKISVFNRTQTAHLYGLRIIEHALLNAGELRDILRAPAAGIGGKGPRPLSHTKEILEAMGKKFYTITRSLQHVLEPSRQYLKWVLNRELAAPAETFDAGELVFAATSYGAIINWRMDDRLTRACELLITSLPPNGRLPTKRPFHADRRGYRIVPIGCEMTRALANLFQKTGYDFDAKFVGKMLSVFEEQLIELHESTAKTTLIGWNFDGAPDPGKPAVWVTAVAVLALDRIVRMLNKRINEIVLAHFDVTTVKRPHTRLALRDLIYSDHALGIALPQEDGLTAIHLQKVRAHVMRAKLPAPYQNGGKNFSTIYYGPPGTGKTTLAESLALSAEVPLLRLSPGDLILQGQEMIEGRAHDVFEALSMLTQCVIIFDEFEPVLTRRQEKGGKDNIDSQFRFVLGGMLPKLVKLHDSAETQSFAYCLGTNYLNKIDPAAKRPGRFDEAIPVYKPDALSRAGALLYALSRTGEVRSRRKGELQRFYEIIGRTIGEPADRISRLFSFENDRGLSATLKYIVGRGPLPGDLNTSRSMLERLKKQTEVRGVLESRETKERKWIHSYEKRFLNAEKHVLTDEAKPKAQTWDVVFALLRVKLNSGIKSADSAH
jgi:hypothetical protein